MAIAFTGPRKLPHDKILFVLEKLKMIAEDGWYVGDAAGVDDLVRSYAEKHEKSYAIFYVEGTARWQYAQRTRTMIDKLSQTKNPKLYAFPNKNCPDGCSPYTLNGCGSGTWLAIAYAVKLGIDVEIIPLAEIDTPAWIFSSQLSLL
jgi:hypothetical protein